MINYNLLSHFFNSHPMIVAMLCMQTSITWRSSEVKQGCLALRHRREYIRPFLSLEDTAINLLR